MTVTVLRSLPRARRLRRFVFGDAFGGAWTAALDRWGRLGALAHPDEIAVPILNEDRPCGGILFATPAARHVLEHYPSFLDFMEARFPGWTPRRVSDGEIYRREKSLGGDGVSVGPVAGATIQIEAIRGRIEHVLHGAYLAGEPIATITGTIDLGDDLVIKRGAIGYERCADIAELDQVFRVIGYTGFACVNFKMHDGVPKIFEINPRLGGSLVLGPDFDELMGKTAEVLERSWF